MEFTLCSAGLLALIGQSRQWSTGASAHSSEWRVGSISDCHYRPGAFLLDCDPHIWVALRALRAVCAEQPVGYGRKRFALVALDGEFRVSAVAQLLTHLISARKEAGANDLGLGVASMSGFNGTSKALQVRGCRIYRGHPGVHRRFGSQHDISPLMLRVRGCGHIIHMALSLRSVVPLSQL